MNPVPAGRSAGDLEVSQILAGPRQKVWVATVAWKMRQARKSFRTNLPIGDVT